MTVRRGFLYAGVFLLALGGMTLLTETGALDRTAVANAIATWWPLAPIAIGVGLVLRRTRAAIAAGLLAAATPAIVLGGAVHAVPDLALPCTDTRTVTPSAERHDGTFGSRGQVDIALDCGEVTVATAAGSGWAVDVTETADGDITVSQSGDRLSVERAERGRGFGWHDPRSRVDVTLPRAIPLDLGVEINAGRGRLDLAGARLERLVADVNAGDLRLDLSDASLGRLEVDVNAGAASIALPAASLAGDLSVNAGALELCVPETLGLRLRGDVTPGTADINGLIRRGDAWETPSYATAPLRADLSLSASVGSVEINPEGDCK